MNVLVTGSAGFLGRRVIAALRERLHSIRALDLPRPAGATAEPDPPGVERFHADLCTAQDLETACQGMDLVIHLAARMSGDASAVVGTAVEGTSRLLDAMERTRVPRLVLASSLSVYDWSSGTGRLDEDSPLETRPESRDAYTLAKLRQEQLARERCSRARIRLTVLRPGILWGPDHSYPATIGQRLGPLHVAIGAGRQLPAVHVENCADAFAAVAGASNGSDGTFNVIDHPELTVGRFVRDYLRESGELGFMIPAPYRASLACVRGLHRVVPRSLEARLPSFLGPERFVARYSPVVVESIRLREVFAWRPPLAYEECWRRTFTRRA